LGPWQEEVVRLDAQGLEVRGAQEAVDLRLRVAELGEAQSLAAQLPQRVERAQRRVHDEAAEGVVEGDDEEEESSGFEDAVDLAEQLLRAVLEVLRDVRRERGVEGVVPVGRRQGVAAYEAHVGIVPAREPQRTPAVVDAEGLVSERLEEGHPAAAPAARLEDLPSRPGEVLAED